MPKDIEIGDLATARGVMTLRLHIVLLDSSSNDAFGNRAWRHHVSVRSEKREGRQTIFQCGYHCDQGGIECISIVIDAGGVNIEHPD